MGRRRPGCVLARLGEPDVEVHVADIDERDSCRVTLTARTGLLPRIATA